MPPKINKPISFSIVAPPGFGKSWLAAKFVKLYDGMIFDFAKVSRVYAPKVSQGPKPTFNTGGEGPINVGDAYPAIETVGIKFDQYSYVESWNQFKDMIEIAKCYRDSSPKKNGRIWIVIDDTTNFRWQCLIWTLQQTKHEAPSNPDWTMCNLELNSMMQTLTKNFNLIYVSQVKEEYDKISEKSTGKLVPQFYPTNMEHIVDASLEYMAGTDENGEYPLLKVRKLRNRWRFQRKPDESIPKEIEFRDPENISPETILEALKFDKELW